MADAEMFGTVCDLYGQALQYRTEILDLRAERDRCRQAIDDAIDELMCGDTKTAMAVLERALNQTREDA